MKNQHYHKRSRDLYPKPFTNHYSERFPWKEPDDEATTIAMLAVAVASFLICVGGIIIIAALGRYYNW